MYLAWSLKAYFWFSHNWLQNTAGIIYSFFLCETAVVPSRNPFLNLLRTTFKCLIRPVPVVWRLVALTDHPYPRILAPGYPQAAQIFFWMWRETRPHRRHKVCVLLRLLPNELVPLVWNIKINIILVIGPQYGSNIRGCHMSIFSLYRSPGTGNPNLIC